MFVQDTQLNLIGSGGDDDGEGAGFDIDGEEGSVHLPLVQIPKGTECHMVKSSKITGSPQIPFESQGMIATITSVDLWLLFVCT